MHAAGLLAVQVSDQNAHPLMPGRSGAWGIAIMFLGLALICHGAVPMVRVRRWRTHALRARGRVVDNVPRLFEHRKTVWLPLVEFRVAGATVLSCVSTPQAPRGLPLGQAVDVLYDPIDPRNAALADTRSTVSGTLIVGVFVVGLFLALAT